MREEHVDGGYLVTLGTYVGSEDYNKQIVRQLQIDRRLAPFWRGLNDFSSTWTEYQIAAAARGLDVPAADDPPPDDFFSRPGTALSSSPSRSNFALAAPAAGHSAGSSTNLASSPPTDIASGAIPVGSLAGTSSPAAIPTSPTAVSTPGANTPRGTGSLKPRAKALAAALSGSSRNGSSTDIASREVQLPHEPFVNGQPIEVFLYKNADECPICFLTYPPYLNHTRCCHQDICSECFVQIKRADPHYPEGHGENGDTPNPDLHPEEQAGQLISEPACCPYCQQPEFGVTYDPPPFRRGLVHSSGSLSHGIGAMGAAMSSTSSIGSAQPGLSASPPAGSLTPGARRRAQSLSANAPNVITTDRVRPDWATKLASQRAQIARRAAAATALHTAAFLMGPQEGRSLRLGRFRRGASSSDGAASRGDGTPSTTRQTLEDVDETMDPGQRTTSVGQGSTQEGAAVAPRRTNMEDLEELMFREALRQSLATEEERRRQEEKKERKEAQKREKRESKGDRKSLGGLMKRLGSGSPSSTPGAGPYSSQSSASASSLSVAAGNRRRGNSNASNLRVEASVASAMVISSNAAGATGGAPALIPASDSTTTAAATSTSTSAATAPAPAASSASPVIATAPVPTTEQPDSKGKGVDRGPDAEPSTAAARPIPTPTQPSAGPSHLRQMSSASSVSSIPESAPSGSFASGSHHYVNMQEHLQDPRESGLSLGSRSAGSDDADHEHDHDDHDHEHGDHNDHADDPSTSADPLFNFGSLAAAVGVQIEGPHAGRRLSAIQRDHSTEKEDVEHAEHAEHATPAPAPPAPAPADVTASTSSVDIKAPEVLITPGTPAQADKFE